jgi:hypothetical protein
LLGRISIPYYDYQLAVGGYVESVKIRQPALALFFDEDGGEKCLPVNRRATAVWWLFEPVIRGKDRVVGDAGLVGGPDTLGDMTSVPDELASFLIDRSR